MHGIAAALIVVASAAADSPTVYVDRDDVVISESCRVRFARRPVVDANGDGVLHVRGDDIRIDFDPAPLRGAAEDVPPDRYAGTGIRVTGRNVTLVGARVGGFRCGVHASGTDGLTVDGGDLSGNFRQRLRSTAEAEHAADWLRPHENDRNEWLLRYGAALYVEDATGVTVRGLVVRDGQNGIILDRVGASRIHDNDCSFLSGWGLALWRSSGNVIARNAFDFCVRGYSHGVYNRGQDSAGILLFEQCHDNVIVENSATHGGDGLFAFSGREALGEVTPREDPGWYRGLGHRGNLIVRNDFSHAAAHGVELTFGFDNRISGNRLVGNAICGIWGGYSQRTMIDGNTIEENGEAGAGLERGGVNIEHSVSNAIIGNAFARNRCGVHLWWDDDAALLATPWAQANDPGCRDNVIAGNTFDGDGLAVHLRDTTGATLVGHAALDDVGRALDAGPTDLVAPIDALPAPPLPPLEIPGTSRPVGARAALGGRDAIIMTEWGPYDWKRPMLRRVRDERGGHAVELLGAAADIGLRDVTVRGDVSVRRRGDRLELLPDRGGDVAGFEIEVTIDDRTYRERGVVTNFEWSVTAFPWESDPRDDLDGWYADARSVGRSAVRPDLRLRYGSAGPEGVRPDRFGTIAEATGRFPAGTWLLRTLSDDGIRVWVNGELLVDDWTWHAPREHTFELDLDVATDIDLRVEHFELDGWAVLEVGVEEWR